MTITRRNGQPTLSRLGEQILAQYEQRLRVEEDLAPATIRNYLSDLRHFAAWCESTWKQGREAEPSFAPEAVTTPTLTDYRSYLQQEIHLKPNSVNRSLISLKRYFAWLITTGQFPYNPAKVVKLVGEETTSPRHLDDQEEQALMATVKNKGSMRDQAIIVLMLHTGLRAREVYTLTRSQIRLGKRSGSIIVQGKRNKYREVPLNATARLALLAYDPFLMKYHAQDTTPLFCSEKQHTRLTERGLGYLVKKYAEQARLHDVSPHDLRHRFGLANPLVPGMAGPMLCWLAEHDACSYQEARWALQPKDWLRLCLTHEVATDPSDASATLLYDLSADSWAENVIASLGLKRSLLPPIIPSGAIAGRLSARTAEALGLPVGLPVATGAADTAAAALGTGLLTPGPIQLTLGTGAQLIQPSSEPIADPTGRTHLYRAADGAHWYAMAAVQNAGLALDWVRQMLGATWDDVYTSAAAVPPGADGLLFLPYLTRERPHHPIPGSSGAFLGMRIDHRREHLLHAALEGVAFGIRVAFEALPAASVTTTLRLAGGGSEHPAWRQMLADILNRELLTIDTPAASVRGAALLGGIASGIWTDALETTSIAPHTSLIAAPEKGRVAAYSRVYTRYLESINK